MRRSRDRDDYDDETLDYRPKKRPFAGVPPAAWLLIIPGALGAFAILFFMAASAVGPFVIADGDSNAEPGQPVDLKTLLADWKQNPALVQDRNLGKIIRISGLVVDVDQAEGVPYLDLSADGRQRLGEPVCRVFFLRRGLRGELKNYPKGSTITVDASFGNRLGLNIYVQAVRVLPPG